MVDLIKKGNPPYTPAIMSWLSGQLDKPSRLITPDEIKKVVSLALLEARSGASGPMILAIAKESRPERDFAPECMPAPSL